MARPACPPEAGLSGIDLTDVSFSRGRRVALSRIGVAFAAGRLTAVIGPNGAGKSTLLALAAGLLAPTAGSIRLGGVKMADIPRRILARRRAYLPQRAGVDWPLSVERVIALGLTPALPAFGGLPPELAARVATTMEAFDLAGLRARPATSLSGGELARTMLARACVGDPELLIVDEPTSGLDPRHAIDAARRLRARADAGRTVVVAMHDLDLALGYADDVVALRDGMLLAATPAATVDAVLLERLFDLQVRICRDPQVNVQYMVR